MSYKRYFKVLDSYRRPAYQRTYTYSDGIYDHIYLGNGVSALLLAYQFNVTGYQVPSNVGSPPLPIYLVFVRVAPNGQIEQLSQTEIDRPDTLITYPYDSLQNIRLFNVGGGNVGVWIRWSRAIDIWEDGAGWYERDWINTYSRIQSATYGGNSSYPVNQIRTNATISDQFRIYSSNGVEQLRQTTPIWSGLTGNPFTTVHVTVLRKSVTVYNQIVYTPELQIYPSQPSVHRVVRFGTGMTVMHSSLWPQSPGPVPAETLEQSTLAFTVSAPTPTTLNVSYHTHSYLGTYYADFGTGDPRPQYEENYPLSSNSAVSVVYEPDTGKHKVYRLYAGGGVSLLLEKTNVLFGGFQSTRIGAGVFVFFEKKAREAADPLFGERESAYLVTPSGALANVTGTLRDLVREASGANQPEPYRTESYGRNGAIYYPNSSILQQRGVGFNLTVAVPTGGAPLTYAYRDVVETDFLPDAGDQYVMSWPDGYRFVRKHDRPLGLLFWNKQTFGSMPKDGGAAFDEETKFLSIAEPPTGGPNTLVNYYNADVRLGEALAWYDHELGLGLSIQEGAGCLFKSFTYSNSELTEVEKVRSDVNFF